MKIIVGIILILTSMYMRHWGRKQAMVQPWRRPRHQWGNNFWFILSLIGIALLVTGISLITVEVFG
jgi:uncharacterized iron-regulated membrane protein